MFKCNFFDIFWLRLTNRTYPMIRNIIRFYIDTFKMIPSNFTTRILALYHATWIGIISTAFTDTIRVLIKCILTLFLVIIFLNYSLNLITNNFMLSSFIFNNPKLWQMIHFNFLFDIFCSISKLLNILEHLSLNL